MNRSHICGKKDEDYMFKQWQTLSNSGFGHDNYNFRASISENPV